MVTRFLPEVERRGSRRLTAPRPRADLVPNGEAMRSFRPGVIAAILFATVTTVHAAGTLRVGMQDDPDALDPARGGTFAGRIVFASLCDKLIDLAPDLSFVPQLATAWSWSQDNKALTLTLRDNVRFQDDEPFDADAVRVNLERYRSAPESNRKGELKPVTGVDVIDAKTVRLNLSQPYAPLIAVLSDRAGMMASPKQLAALGRDFANHPVCAGPFSFVERVAQDRMLLTRFPGYWNADAIHLDRIEFHPIADSTTRLVNLQAGQLDMLEELAPTDATKVEQDSRLKLRGVTSLGYEAIDVNLGHGPAAENPLAKDPRVRAALEASIDREALNKVVMDSRFVPDNQSELPNSPFFNKDFPVPPRDIGRAKSLLRQAGYDRVSFTLRTLNTPTDTQIGEVLQSMAAEAGIDIKLAAGETNANIQAMNAGDYQTSLVLWSGRSDPDFNVVQFLACDGFQNWGHYCNEKFDAALNKGRTDTDPTQRAAAYHEAASTYLADRPLIFLFHMTWLYAHSTKLHGFTAVPDGLIRPQGLTLGP
jgi:peptide/nickel transport system substrate-binding protein